MALAGSGRDAPHLRRADDDEWVVEGSDAGRARRSAVIRHLERDSWLPAAGTYSTGSRKEISVPTPGVMMENEMKLRPLIGSVSNILNGTMLKISNG